MRWSLIFKFLFVFFLNALNTSTLGGFALAQTLADVATPVGQGAEFNIESQAGAGKVAIYFLKPPHSQAKVVEMYFNALNSFVPIQMWQQFLLEKKGPRLSITKGYIFSDQMKTRELDQEYLQGFDGVQMNQFLIATHAELEQYFVSDEDIEVPATNGHKIKAKHYRMSGNGQTIDFWIHPSEKPIGLLKIVSKGSQASQNYSMKMNRKLKGVAAKIDPVHAQKMDDQTRKYLPQPNSFSTGMRLF